MIKKFGLNYLLNDQEWLNNLHSFLIENISLYQVDKTTCNISHEYQ